MMLWYIGEFTLKQTKKVQDNLQEDLSRLAQWAATYLACRCPLMYKSVRMYLGITNKLHPYAHA